MPPTYDRIDEASIEAQVRAFYGRARRDPAIGPVFEAAVDPVLAVAVLDAYQKQAPGYRRLQPPQVLAGLPRSPLGKLRRADALAALISGARA